jgi:hypothetical protein
LTTGTPSAVGSVCGVTSGVYFRNTTEIRDVWHRKDDRRRTQAEATRELDPV